jgi:hypothetical protein
LLRTGEHVMAHEVPGYCLGSIRPLVRYVDETQAVIDVHFDLVPNASSKGPTVPAESRIDVEIEMAGIDGYAFQHRARVQLQENRGLVRFEMKCPHRWWPLGMGEQFLYDLTVMLVVDDDVAELWQTTIGLTSVRVPRSDVNDDPVFLINGRERMIQTVIPVQPVDEHGVLAVGNDSLLLVRDHYGSDLLYDAADRAGILLVQSIPLKAQSPQSREQMQAEVDRLASHPSLAGWMVDHRHASAPVVVQYLRAIDPTRQVLGRLPMG